jgi:hypothetical protein
MLGSGLRVQSRAVPSAHLCVPTIEVRTVHLSAPHAAGTGRRIGAPVLESAASAAPLSIASAADRSKARVPDLHSHFCRREESPGASHRGDKKVAGLDLRLPSVTLRG